MNGDDRQELLRQIETREPAVRQHVVRVHVVAWIALILSTLTAVAAALSFAADSRRQQQIAEVTIENCARLHRVVLAGTAIIDARVRLKVFYKQGVITKRQYDEGVKQTVRSLRIWKAGDCDPSEGTP